MSIAVIFTDLGTMLDQETGSHAQSQPALDLIRKSGSPLILCSAKTRSELLVHRSRIDNVHPFIAENGGGIFIPYNYFSIPFQAEKSQGYHLISLGENYTKVRQEFVRLREQLKVKVRGFGDMTVDEIALLSGLSIEDAALAKQRDFDEPFVFDGIPDERFLIAIDAAGLRWTRGKFFHIMGNHDKGRAVKNLMSLYRRQFGQAVSIALGNDVNDLPMLIAVDKKVLVKHKDSSLDLRIPILNIIKTRHYGPAGWNEAVLELLGHQFEPDIVGNRERQNLIDIFNSALISVDPYDSVLQAAKVEFPLLIIQDSKFNIVDYQNILVIGAGKAAARMAMAIETLLGDRISAGLIIVKEGHTEVLSYIEQIEASHPVPNKAGIIGTQRILKMVREAGKTTLVICLISGGASALMIAPVEGISLQDKQDTTQLLLNCGATIFELNTVRKHISAVKGGKLAQAIFPAQLVTLILSDVIGDPVDVIASGPTAVDVSTYADAWSVITKYGLEALLPPGVTSKLKSGLLGNESETIKVGDPCMVQSRNYVVASNRQALIAARNKAIQLGFTTRIVSDMFQGEVREAALYLAKLARHEISLMISGEKRCLLFGGETTVKVLGDGKGGRNQELALYFAMEIENIAGISLLSAGTDGSDGPTDAAGALVDGNTLTVAKKFGINPQSYLSRNDTYNFYSQLGSVSGMNCLIKTGPTGTNVMDIQILVLSK